MSGHVHIYRGPAMEEPKPVNPPHKRSAAWCPKCKQRRVQELMVQLPVMDEETMRPDQLMAAAFCGPEYVWSCPCGHYFHAPGFEPVGW